MASTGFPKRGTRVIRKAEGLIGEVYAIDPSKDLLTVRWAARPGHNTLVCTSEQFARDWDLRDAEERRITGGKPDKHAPVAKAPIQSASTDVSFSVISSNFWTIWRGSVLAVSFIALTVCAYISADLNGCFKFRYPTSVLNHNTSIVGGNTELDVTLKLRGWDAGDTDMYSAILDMESIMKHEIKEGSPGQNIVFHIVGDAGGGKDDYGNPKPSRIIGAFDIQYSMEDIKKIDWDHISQFRLLNLGIVSGITPAGADVAKGYCEKNREYSQSFCARF